MSRSSARWPRATGWAGSGARLRRPSEAQLELVHSARHIERIKELSLAGGGAIDADTFVGEPSYRAALHAAGGACEMTRALLAGEAAVGFCGCARRAITPNRDRAMGFCLFNNVALAAEFAIRELGARRVFVLDWDVHHGNGTAEAFRRRRDVLFASIHQSRHLPGHAARSATSARARARATRSTCPSRPARKRSCGCRCSSTSCCPPPRAFEPELVLVSAGFDAHREDPLAGCRLESGLVRARWPATCATSPSALDAPLGVVLEGGYEPAGLAECVRATLAALARR